MVTQLSCNSYVNAIVSIVARATRCLFDALNESLNSEKTEMQCTNKTSQIIINVGWLVSCETDFGH